jgi:hypothetical protein
MINPTIHRRLQHAWQDFNRDTDLNAGGRFADMGIQPKLGLRSKRRLGLGCLRITDTYVTGLFPVTVLISERIIMRSMYRIAIAFSLLIAIGCEKAAEKHEIQHEVDHAAKTIAASVQTAKQEFHKTMEARLKNLESDITKLREKGRDLKGTAQTDWDRKMVILETKLDTTRAKLTEVSHASEEAWKDLQTHVQSTWDDLERSVQEALR